MRPPQVQIVKRPAGTIEAGAARRREVNHAAAGRQNVTATLGYTSRGVVAARFRRP